MSTRSARRLRASERTGRGFVTIEAADGSHLRVREVSRYEGVLIGVVLVGLVLIAGLIFFLNQPSNPVPANSNTNTVQPGLGY
jgi:hypothetical protein